MKKTEDTSETPGPVPRICSGGRMVAAVVWAAPATMPSTSSRCSIMVATVMGSARRSRAASRVSPLLLRAATSAST